MTEVIQKVQLVEGSYTPSEASDIVSSLIKEKINFHKIQRLGQVIHNESADTQFSLGRIKELENEMKIAKEFIAQSRSKGRSIRITGTLEITYEG